MFSQAPLEISKRLARPSLAITDKWAPRRKYRGPETTRGAPQAWPLICPQGDIGDQRYAMSLQSQNWEKPKGLIYILMHIYMKTSEFRLPQIVPLKRKCFSWVYLVLDGTNIVQTHCREIQISQNCCTWVKYTVLFILHLQDENDAWILHALVLTTLNMTVTDPFKIHVLQCLSNKGTSDRQRRIMHTHAYKNNH